MSNYVFEQPVKCVSCDEEFELQETMVTNNGDPICESCHQDDTSDPMAEITIHHSKGEELYENIDIINIGYYASFSSDSIYEGDFKLEHHYNNYRGYTDVKSDNWTEIALVNTSEEYKAKMVNSFGHLLLDKNIEYASYSARTSNCMVVNLTYWVKNEDVKKALRIKKRLLKQYNMNEDDF